MATDVAESKDEGLLDAASLCNLFEEAEQASYEARQNSERDRDYVDGIQLDAETIAALRKRKQPEIIINRIKRKIDFLKGYEQSQRISPRALPRTMAHEADSEAAEQALRYVADVERYDAKRSRVWDNLLVEGCGGYSVGVKEGHDGIDITINQVPWDRMFFDPHSSYPDFSDAGYLGLVRWEDYDEAAAQYPDAADILTTTLAGVSQSDTYDDKPKYNVWADPKRRRVRICQIWIKREGKWFFAEYTKGGILKAGPSPYVDDKGESVCELLFGSAYVNRDNERYGIVREMIGPQDEINKRRSKALHLLNTNQTIFEEGAVQDVDALRRESAKPDGTIKLNPGGFDKFKMETRTDLATGHMQLLQEAKNEIDMMAGNIALQGNALQSNTASGKAIIASQQGGAMEIAPILDQLRDLDIRVFRAIWYRVRQFWTAEKWIRITDDERNVKWVGLNVDPMQVQMAAMQNPEMGQKIAGVVPSVAHLDCDIIIDDSPDSITPQLEQWQSLVELAKFGVPIPPDVLIKSAPNLKNKYQLLDAMEKAQQNMPPPPPDPATLRAQEAQTNAQLKAQEMALDAQLKREQMQLDLHIAHEKLTAEMAIEQEKMQAQTAMNVEKMRAEGETKNELDAKNPVIKSNVDLSSAVQSMVEGTAAVQQAIAAMTAIHQADVELVRDPTTGRAVGARKVIRQPQPPQMPPDMPMDSGGVPPEMMQGM